MTNSESAVPPPDAVPQGDLPPGTGVPPVAETLAESEIPQASDTPLAADGPSVADDLPVFEEPAESDAPQAGRAAPRATVADLFWSCLRERGLAAVYGMPGNQNVALYDALARATPAIPHYLVRHEQGATMLAAGHARATGKIAAALTVPGPGAANASAGLLDALNDNIPVLAIVGGYEKAAQGKDPAKLFHGLDQEAFHKPLAKYFGSPTKVKDIPRVIDAAFAALRGVR
ncbi:MAG: thiamine pyrophosphate-binding protein, partial [Planctomycetaceae bacterium]